jgi:hypothetical protein
MTSESDDSPERLAANFRQLVEQNQQLLAALRTTASDTEQVPTDVQSHGRLNRRKEYLRQWQEEILPYKLNQPNSPLRELHSSFRWPRKLQALDTGPSRPDRPSTLPRNSARITENDGDEPEEERKLEDIFLPDKLWNSWQYRMAYPHLSKFLGSADPSEETRTKVRYMDFHPDDANNHTDGSVSWENGDLVRSDELSANAAKKVLQQDILDHHELWKHIRIRTNDRPTENFSELTAGGPQHKYRIPCRILQITDLSAVVAGLIIASTPHLDLSYVAPFLERYLKFSNWAMVNMVLARGDNIKCINTFLFEYHFAFYYIPIVSMDRDLVSKDFRKIRNAARFDNGASNCHRHIYEEQMSFILVGHGGDVFTNYQVRSISDTSSTINRTKAGQSTVVIACTPNVSLAFREILCRTTSQQRGRLACLRFL